MATVVAKDPAEAEFYQAVGEVISSLEPVLERQPRYRQNKLLERIIEPERVMRSIHRQCRAVADAYGRAGDYVFAANAAGFEKVADAMLDQGIV